MKQNQKAHEAISKVLNLAGIAKEPSLEKWASMVEISDNLHVQVGLNSPKQITQYIIIASHVSFLYHRVKFVQVRIAVVGKYTDLSDAYLSVLKVNTSLSLMAHYSFGVVEFST